MFDCVHPCPCGYFGDSQKPCTCAHSVVTKYQKRISGPMLDRKVPRVDYEKLSSDRLGESSASIRERVQAARERQRVRYEGSDIVCPVREPGLSQLRYTRGGSQEVLQIRRSGGGAGAGGDIALCMSQLNLSARGYHRVLKLARTIADLAGSEQIQAEALQYRPKILS